MATPIPPPQSTGLMPAEDNGGWFTGNGSWFPEFTWWGSSWNGQRLPPPNTMSAPQPLPVPDQGDTGMATAQPSYDMTKGPGAGLSAPAYAPQPVDPGPVVNEYNPGQKYSFLDAPGASDALVAFGAAMLKAPDFNTGLGDAALAVNRVAQGYRMPTEADYARAKQLGMLERIRQGKSGTGDTKVNDKVPMYDQQGKLYYTATGPNGEFGVWDTEAQQFIPGGVPGLVRATDSAVGSINKYSSKSDSEAEQQLYNDSLAANDNLIQLENLKQLRPSAGVGLDFMTRTVTALVKLTGEPIGSIDPTSVSSLQASTRQMGLNWSQKMRGQGQVTEFERQQIVEMLPQALQDPQAFDNLVNLLTQLESRKQALAQEWFADPMGNRQRYGTFRGFMLQRINQMPIKIPTTGNTPDKPSATDSGTTNSGIKWKIEQ